MPTTFRDFGFSQENNGTMPEDFKPLGWDSQQFRIDAGNKLEDIDRRIDAVNQQIAALGTEIYAREDVAQKFGEAVYAGRRAIYDVMDRLEKDPREFGRLRGDAAQVVTLVRLLDRQADLLASKEEYSRLMDIASQAEALPKDERMGQNNRLLREREYCEANFQTRELRYSGPGEPADSGGDSVGAMRVDRKKLAAERNALLEANREAERQRRLARSRGRDGPDLAPPDPDLDGR